MNTKSLLLGLALFAGAQFSSSAAQDEAVDKNRLHKFLPVEDKSTCSLAYQWLDIAEEATAREVDLRGARPTVIARTLAIWATAMYDAWAVYDPKAVGSRLGGQLRRPPADRSLANKEKAISYASYHALVFVYPESAEWLAEQMKQLGYDPSLISEDPTKPEGVGYLTAQAVIECKLVHCLINCGSEKSLNENKINCETRLDYIPQVSTCRAGNRARIESNSIQCDLRHADAPV